MELIKLKVIDEIIYHETLENGLNIYIYKNPNFQKKSAFFQTKYGSLNNDFIPIGENELKSFPLGIAHFLEHKLFESEDNSNVFEKFEKNGAYVNAMTSYDSTTYYFISTDYFYENLEILINMVQSPYFTDENVEKEKGIIGQEIDMYSNDPDQALYDKLKYNIIKTSPLRFDIAGTKEEVNKITKEDLYKCYNTFYHPSNMNLFIAGDVDENEVIDFVKENQKRKKFEKECKIVNKEYNEPKEVLKKEETIYHNVTATKIGYGYKLVLPKVKPKEDFLRKLFIKIFLATKFGSVTTFSEDLIKEKLVKSYFYYDYTLKGNIFMIFFTGDVLNDKEVEKKIQDKLNDLNNLEEMFNLYKKNYVSNCVKTFESIDGIQSLIRGIVKDYGYFFEDLYDVYNNASYDDYIKFIKSLDFSNKSKIIIKKED